MKLRSKTLNRAIFEIFVITMLSVFALTTIFSLMFFSYNIDKTAIKFVNDSSEHISYNYESYINDVIETSMKIEEELNKNTIENVDKLHEYLEGLLFLQSKIKGVALYTLDGRLITKTSEVDSLSYYSTTNWFNNTINDHSIHHLTIIDEASSKVKLSKVINTNNLKSKAILALDFSLIDLLRLDEINILGEGGCVLLVDEYDNIIYHTINDELLDIDDRLEYIKKNVLGSGTYKNKGNEYLSYISSIANTKWRIVTFYNVNEFNSIVTSFLIIFTSIVLFSLILALIYFRTIVRKMTDPLKQLEQSMKEIDFNNPIKLITNEKCTTEIIALNNSYNLMLDHIKYLLDKIILEQTNQRKSELKALQNQINPHFLYNTLDSIIAEIENNELNDAKGMIMALSKLFRISISRGNNIIPVRNEIAHVENYLYIQQMRYKDAFSYEINIDEDCYKYKVMKLILQPIVENSIYHGLKNKIDKGLIRIDGRINNKNLEITVTDNGYGIEEEKINELYKLFENPNLSDGVGLKNVFQRLRLYYGDNAYLKIESEIDYYTKITLSVPVEVENEKG